MSKRPSARARGYDSKWDRERLEYLRKHRRCVRCGGVVKLSGERGDRMVGVVDHKVPHRGNRRLFWDRSNWQTLHKGCHDGWKKSLEMGGGGCDANGVPLSPDHHWNQGEGGSKSSKRIRSGPFRPVLLAFCQFSNFRFSGAT